MIRWSLNLLTDLCSRAKKASRVCCAAFEMMEGTLLKDKGLDLTRTKSCTVMQFVPLVPPSRYDRLRSESSAPHHESDPDHWGEGDHGNPRLLQAGSETGKNK